LRLFPKSPLNNPIFPLFMHSLTSPISVKKTGPFDNYTHRDSPGRNLLQSSSPKRYISTFTGSGIFRTHSI
jgi:hypothetical protein